MCLVSSGRLKSKGVLLFSRDKNITFPEIQASSARLCLFCLFVSFWNLSGYSNGFRTSARGRSDDTDLIPSLSVKMIFHQENVLQMFHQKGHVALEEPSGGFPGYLTLSGPLSARGRRQPLIRFSQQAAISIWHYSNMWSVVMTNTCGGTVAHAEERKHCDSRASVLSERRQNAQRYK